MAYSMDIPLNLSLIVMLTGLTTSQNTIKYGNTVDDGSCMAQYSEMSHSMSKMSKDIKEIMKTLKTHPNNIVKKDSQYHMFYNKTKWVDADLSCFLLGGHLVSFEDLAELQAVSNMTEQCPGSTGYWTAGRDIGNYTWIWRNSGDPILADLWHVAEPNQRLDCVLLWTNVSPYALADNSCEDRRCYICEI